MKTKLTQRRYRAQKRSACAMCKPQQRGWADKKTVADLRRAVGQEQQWHEEERDSVAPGPGYAGALRPGEAKSEDSRSHGSPKLAIHT